MSSSFSIDNTVYLDSAATTKPRSEAVKAASRAMTEIYGNPSSNHIIGRAAAAALSDARLAVAAALSAKPENIAFTSGGTESDNLAILGAAERGRRFGKHVITSKAEHSAVLNTFKRLEKLGYEVEYISPDISGAVTPQALDAVLRRDTTLISLMHVNNESGAINPTYEFGKLIRQKAVNALFHVDAQQSFGKLPISPEILGADLISVSAHKIYGIKGAGALYYSVNASLPPISFGGQQESGARSGTEAMPAIMAFGAAAAFIPVELAGNMNHAARLRQIVTERLAEIPGFTVLAEGSPYILSMSLPGYRSEVLMNCLDDAGICLSRSSACKRGQRSRVLEAMKLPAKVIDGALRVSFGMYTTEEDVSYFCQTLIGISKRLVHR